MGAVNDQEVILLTNPGQAERIGAVTAKEVLQLNVDVDVASKRRTELPVGLTLAFAVRRAQIVLGVPQATDSRLPSPGKGSRTSCAFDGAYGAGKSG